jgi:uncharacterized protein (UPF0297 family)
MPVVAVAASPVEVKPPQAKVLSSPEGRYIFGQISDFRSDQFLLDTKTGRLWQIVKNEKDRTLLQPVGFLQILGDEAYIPDTDEEAKTMKGLSRQRTIEEWKKSQQNSEPSSKTNGK